MLNPPLYPRNIEFEAILNFRDLGGYQTANNRSVAWRRAFRSGELRHASTRDLLRLQSEAGIRSILDLRHEGELGQYGTGPVASAGFNYYNVPLITDPENTTTDIDQLRKFTHLGQLYLFLIGYEEYGRRLVQCLRVIADPDNHPIVFHCSAGKDRTGLLASMVLSVLGVNDEDIAADYTLTGPHMRRHLARYGSDPEAAKFLDSLPRYMHESAGGSMQSFLSAMRREYGSIRGYLQQHGAAESLFADLEKALLV